MAEATNSPKIDISTEEAREELIYQLVDEFRQSIGSAFNDEKKYSFIAGARAALYMLSRDSSIAAGEKRE